MLSNQLFGELREDIDAADLDAQYLVVHSAGVNDKRDYAVGVPYRETPSTTSSVVVHETYEKAVREGVSLIISSTYHSADRIVESGIPVNVVYADESHYTVSDQFHWITNEFPADKIFFFTATRRVTTETGNGQTNIELYGSALVEKSWAEMVSVGEIVRGRFHIVDIESDEDLDETSADVRALITSFDRHQEEIGYGRGAKLLVVAKGTTHLNEMASHPEMVEFCRREGIHLYDVTSNHGSRINGEDVSRNQFLRDLRDYGKDDNQRMIIMHVQILTEGIDVPGITGILPFNNMGVDVFLQTLGRATRLHPADRDRLYSGEMNADDLNSFIKPYAWVVIPAYGNLGEEIRSNIQEMVSDLRAGEILDKEVTVSTSRGEREEEDPDNQNELDTRGRMYQVEMDEIRHEIEDEVEARRIAELKKSASVKSADDLLSQSW
jgi:superfamily II DNA or RNA helicase